MNKKKKQNLLRRTVKKLLAPVVREVIAERENEIIEATSQLIRN